MRGSILVALLPLAIGVGAYAYYWDARRDAFREELTGLLGEDAGFALRGFPYRLQADLGEVRLHEEGEASALAFAADALTLERQPWRPGLTVAGARQPRVMVAATAIGGARLDVEAESGRASVRAGEEGLQRLSASFRHARVWLQLLPVLARAEEFELHVREAPTGVEGRLPTAPTRAHAVVRAKGLRLDGGDALALEAALDVTADTPLASVAGWRRGGTVELKRLRLADGDVTVAELSATAVPRADGRLMLAGTVSTVCPESVVAAFAGRPAPAREFRARRAVEIAFSGVAGSVELALPEGGLRRLPVRAQEPPCPRLRGS